MTTLADVAQEVGCSIATASRALAGNPRISEATRARVAAAAEQLGYRGSAALRAALHRQRTIGVVIPSIRNGPYNDGTSLLHDVLFNEGYKTILCCHNNDAALDAKILRSLVDHPVDGIVHTPCTPEGVEGVLGGAAGIPIVELGTRSSSQRVDVICADEEAAVRELVEHLTALGHRRIALFTGRAGLFHIQSRATAFERATRRGGLNTSACPIVYGPSSVGWFRDAMTELLGRPDAPTAALVGNRPAAIGVLLALEEAKIEIPTAMSVVGFTNEDWFAVTNPPLTTYAHPLREMGMMAAQILLGRLQPDADGEPEPRVIRFAGHISPGRSTAPPRD